ncbi:MAG: MBL fold metallo-hydrolase [Planctomycetota bacterium]|jgi:L-ascorbate metabolism protein UlaG (beta-lactamase superfamily)
MRTPENILVSSEKAEGFTFSAGKENAIAVRWLGQAGFEVFYKNYHLLIDPYLSDHLAKKYAGKEFPHTRMMPSPLAASEINDLDFILCTHRHSDHMDPEAIPILLDNNPGCKLVAPKAVREHVLNNIISDGRRVIFVNADEDFVLAPEINLDVIASSHEELETDKHGNHCYLGYILKLGDITIYHSGDCVPYAGLAKEIKRRNIDVAMLPINGRDEYRKSKGVPGNFTFAESVELCKAAKIPITIYHHFGMFKFNTVDMDELKEKLQKSIIPKSEFIIPSAGEVSVLIKRL